jgi:ankyrin repeat protein
MGRGSNQGPMKSIHLQLLVTLVATAVAAGFLVYRGLPPEIGLFEIADKGDIEAARRSIVWGADVNAKRWDGQTPLHLVVSHARVDLTAFLIAEGADVNAKDRNGASPLHDAWYKDVATLLIARGANVNARGSWMCGTPLHSMVDGNLVDVAALLIANGADVNARIDGLALTPLLMAVKTDECKDMAALLIAKGADVNAKIGVGGVTPLHKAVHYGQTGMVTLLIAKGADVNAKDAYGETPLRDAVKGRHTEVAEILRQHGARE